MIHRRLLRWTAIALSVVVGAFLVRTLRHDGPAALAAWRAAHIRWSWVALSIACGFAGHAFSVIGWRRLLTDSGIRTPLWQLVRIFLVSNLGRYLPGGKVWQMGIVGMMAAEHDLPAAALAASSLFQGVVGVGVGLIVFFAAGRETIGLPTAWLALPIAGLIGLLLLPAVVRSIPRLRAVIAHRFDGVDSVGAGTMWALIWTAGASWVMWGIALYALANALLSESSASISSYIAAWSGSFLAGLIAVVVPAGLGVREEAMQAVLVRAGLEAGDVLALVVVARAWVTVLDVVPAVAVLAFRRLRRLGPTASAFEQK